MLAASNGDPVGGALIVGIIVLLYWAPTFAAFARRVPNKVSVAVVNCFLGWTLIGWVVAAAMAARDVNHAPTAPTIPAAQPAGWYPAPDGQVHWWTGTGWRMDVTPPPSTTHQRRRRTISA